MADDRLDELLLAWQDGTTSLEALCQQTPELAVPLEQGVAVLRKVQQLADSLHGRGSTPSQVETRADVPTGPEEDEAAHDPSLPPGSVIAGYTIERLLGAGGMGEVYLAHDPVLHRPVALKVMKPTIARDSRARDRFLREARAVARLSDDHIVTIHAVGEEDGRLYLVMPLLRGASLQARLKTSPRLPVAEALRIAQETAQGWRRRTPRGWSIATSSRRTCGWKRELGASKSSTSAWRVGIRASN